MDNSLHPWASVVVERQGGCSHQAEQLSSLLLPSCSLLRYLSGGKSAVCINICSDYEKQISFNI